MLGKMTRRAPILVFLSFLALYAATAFPASPFNEQLRQAFAFVHGHLSIDAPQSFLEHAQVGNYSYALHPPLPAFLLIPFAALWGMTFNQGIFSVLIGALNAMLVWVLLGRLKADGRLWLTIFFGAGTIVWYETAIGTTWALPMTTALAFELLTLIELFGEARPLWIGVWGGLAALGRYDLAFVGPAYLLFAWWKGRTVRELCWMAPGFLAAATIYVALNEARYGSPFDIGLWFIPNVHPAAVFGFRYLPLNLNTLFFMAPVVNENFPYIHPVVIGQALTLTSPAFVLALRPSFRRFEVWTMALAAALVSIPMLLCYANGMGQFGTRHFISAFPFLLAMMAMGEVDQLAKILICVSVILIAAGICSIRMWGLGWSY